MEESVIDKRNVLLVDTVDHVLISEFQLVCMEIAHVTVLELVITEAIVKLRTISVYLEL